MEGQVLFFIAIATIIVCAIIWAAIAAQKRRRELTELAARLGLDFRPEKDAGLADGFSFFKRLGQGRDRYAYNILSGQFDRQRVMVFDYHYKTGSGKNTHHHHFTFFILYLPRDFPELLIVPEGFFSKLAQAFGFEDIDFESAEFSRAFCVRSKDKRFAYDVCNPQMMEYLLANRDLGLEIEGPFLALGFDSTLPVDRIELNLVRLVELRSLLPEYLFTRS
jgi:hypothetical protein